MRRLVIGLTMAAFALSGCAEATDEGEAGVDIVTNESVPDEWLEDPTTPLGNMTIYADGEPAERLTLYSGDLGEETEMGENCNHHQAALCGNNQVYYCDGDSWQDAGTTSHIGSLPHVCRNIVDLKRLAEFALDCHVLGVSVRYEPFVPDEPTADSEPYTQPGDSILSDRTGSTAGGSPDPDSPYSGDRSGTDGTTQPDDGIDTSDGTTQPGTSDGTSGTSSGSTGSTSGSGSSYSGSSANDRSGGGSTTQPQQY